MTSLNKSNDVLSLIREASNILGISLSEDGAVKMHQHLLLLMEWRKRANLTALTDPRDIVVLHFIDSLTVFKVIPYGSGMRILDVGTGGGFPGMVLKSVDPSLDMTLLDRNGKKIVFLKYVARELGLTDVTFLHMAVADVLKRHVAPSFEVIVSRAFSSDPFVQNSFSRLLVSGGSLVRMAGPMDSFHSFRLSNFRLQRSWEGMLPFSRHFRRVYRYVVEDVAES
jgi:16S rRNA (guanine527-N7)-methyltransferase